MALGNAFLLEQQTGFLAKVAYHHTFVAWLIEREVVAVFCGNLLNLHALGQMILQLLFGKQAQVAQAIAQRLVADTEQLLHAQHRGGGDVAVHNLVRGYRLQHACLWQKQR